MSSLKLFLVKEQCSEKMGNFLWLRLFFPGETFRFRGTRMLIAGIADLFV